MAVKSERGRKIQELLNNSGWSQNQVAHELGVVQQTVSDWINKDRKPNYHELIGFCRLFGVTVESLIDEKSPIVRQAVSDRESAALDRVRAIGLDRVERVLEAVEILGWEEAYRRIIGAQAEIPAPKLAGKPKR